MALTKISERQIVATSSSGDWIGRPSLLKDGSTWIMVYRAAASHSYDINCRVHIRFSTDEGATWSAEDKFSDGLSVIGAPFAGDNNNDCDIPSLVKAPNGNLLLLTGEREQVYTHTSSSQWCSNDGGKTWIDEGIVCNTTAINCEVISIGANMYAVGYAEDPTRPGGGVKDQLWKSTDFGMSWSLICDITQWIPDSANVDECSICNPSGNTLVVMMRSRGAVQKTYARISPDMGVTWGNVLDLTAQLRVVQRPRLQVFSSEPGRIYASGRDMIADAEHTIVTYSDDGGYTWVAPLMLEDVAQIDCGYSHFLKRADGNLYVVSYRGTYGVATLYEYVVQTEPLEVDYKQIAIDTALQIQQGVSILLDALDNIP